MKLTRRSLLALLPSPLFPAPVEQLPRLGIFSRPMPAMTTAAVRFLRTDGTWQAVKDPRHLYADELFERWEP